MSHISCLIQETGTANTKRDQLAARLEAHHGSHFDGDSLSVGWHTVADGLMFTEGKQSTSSVISCLLEATTTLAERERYMRGICDLWTDETGCTDHEIVVSITETTSERT